MGNDRSDIPYKFVEDVPMLISTLEYGAENDLIGHAFLVKTEGKAIATIMIGEGRLVVKTEQDRKCLINSSSI